MLVLVGANALRKRALSRLQLLLLTPAGLQFPCDGRRAAAAGLQLFQTLEHAKQGLALANLALQGTDLLLNLLVVAGDRQFALVDEDARLDLGEAVGEWLLVGDRAVPDAAGDAEAKAVEDPLRIDLVGGGPRGRQQLRRIGNGSGDGQAEQLLGDQEAQQGALRIAQVGLGQQVADGAALDEAADAITLLAGFAQHLSICATLTLLACSIRFWRSVAW